MHHERTADARIAKTIFVQREEELVVKVLPFFCRPIFWLRRNISALRQFQGWDKVVVRFDGLQLVGKVLKVIVAGILGKLILRFL